MKAINTCPAGQIKGFIETSFSDWPGKVAAVVFLSGCNLRCPYCHNYTLVLSPHFYETIPRPWIASRLREFSGWIDGVVISGGEPCLSPRLPQLIRFFRHLSFPVKLDTNGTKPELLAALLEDGLLDYVAMDVKAPLDDIRYSRCAGVPQSVSPIRRSLAILAQSGIEYELRMTVCPSLTTREDIQDLARQIEGVKRFVLQGFNPKDPLRPELKSVSPYSRQEMLEFQRILKEYVAECTVAG
ncbi:MAG: anaerobic ribonucleoside-triphosphate reductase activating protein [bacterium]|nr:anaerobic ribonucleoside-triphosphate reductase activating protein [bacterium]